MKIGLIGFGQMAQAIVNGWTIAGVNKDHAIFATSASYEELVPLAEPLGVTPLHNNAELAETCDLVILAVKPYLVEQVLGEAKEGLKGKTVVSLAVNIPFDTLIGYVDESTHVLRTLPNTPMAVASGVLTVEEKTNLTDEEWENVKALFEPIATVVKLPSNQIRIAGTLTGCGPAFVDLFIEALGDAGVKYGLPRDKVYPLVSGMISGSALLQQKTGTHPAVLKDRVTSPGGTTIRGICALEENGFRNALIQAIDAIEG